MTRAELREVLARLSPDARARVSATTMAALHEATAFHVAPRRSWAPYASKWEADYAQRLEVLRLVGEIVSAEYEPHALVATGGTKYTPDFLVTFPDGRREYHEVKGHTRSRDAVRMRECVAGSAYPVHVMSKRDGAWRVVRTYHPRVEVEVTRANPED